MTPEKIGSPPASASQDLSDRDFAKFQKYIYETAGIKVGDQKRTLVSNRIRRRLRATGCADFSDYYRLLTSPPGAAELPMFLDEITTNETYFFRDEHQYAWLEKEYLATTFRETQQDGRARTLKFWSAACSTGEEPYSIALCVQQAMPKSGEWSVKIVGTDLSNSVLTRAQSASYDARALQLVKETQRKRYFRKSPSEDRWILNDDVRKLVTFKNHNLLRPMTGGPYDCIFIKNVLIYFDDASKKIVVANLIRELAKGGWLVVGPAEGIFRMLDPLVQRKSWLYQKDS